MNPSFKKYLLSVTKASDCTELNVIQSLWSGYGRISRYVLSDSTTKTVVVKYIALNNARNHPRGWATDFAHKRKIKSYQVETCWYSKWSKFCTTTCRVPYFIGSFSEGRDQWIILEDLNEGFPLRKYELTMLEINVCLEWLANFHMIFLMKIPDCLWETGTYWHLQTRPDELEKIDNQELKAKAHLIDEALNNCQYQTIVHGDAKLANFCFSQDCTQVAAVDFQYVGGGCGMKDVAYFLGSCLSSSECELYQEELLDFYFSKLSQAFKSSQVEFDFIELETEWRKMYSYACTDFTRFLMGWMPTHQKINDYNRGMMKTVLASL